MTRQPLGSPAAIFPGTPGAIMLRVNGSEAILHAVNLALTHLHPGPGEVNHLSNLQSPIHGGFAGRKRLAHCPVTLVK